MKKAFKIIALALMFALCAASSYRAGMLHVIHDSQIERADNGVVFIVIDGEMYAHTVID